jgi:hypothetical protein
MTVEISFDLFQVSGFEVVLVILKFRQHVVRQHFLAVIFNFVWLECAFEVILEISLEKIF